jgi:hypothetical protein
LFDMSGKLLLRRLLKGSELKEIIDLTHYSSNMYILRIIDEKNKLLKSYKVQKIH